MKDKEKNLDWSGIIHLATVGSPKADKRVEKTPDEWRELLSDEAFRVARQAGTERAFSSEMCTRFEPGLYGCVCCETLLFDSNTKFDSGTGWPSFSLPVKDNVVAYKKDTSHGMVRIEAICNSCDAHLGHVFPDGPAPSGLRFCINAVSLKKQAIETD